MNKDYSRIFANWKNIKETDIILICWLIWYFAHKQIFNYYLYSINRLCNKIDKFAIWGLKIDFHLITIIAPTIFIYCFSKLHIVSLFLFSKFSATLAITWKVENIFVFLNDCLKLNLSNKKTANLLTKILWQELCERWKTLNENQPKFSLTS